LAEIIKIKMETVSIVTVTYNNEKGLERTIWSVMNQTYKYKEFIVVDGGSNDDTKSLVAKYKKHINIFISEPDNGIYDALNKGINLAKGEWIVCMNAGDVFASNVVLDEILSKKISEEIDFIYSDYSMRNEDGSIEIKLSDRERGLVFHQASIYRRTLHEKYGFYVVTKPYTVSDLMFFLAVPKSKYMKTDIIISLSDFNGISYQGLWCARDALCLRVVYGIENIHLAYLKFWKCKIRYFLKKILHNK